MVVHMQMIEGMRRINWAHLSKSRGGVRLRGKEENEATTENTVPPPAATPVKPAAVQTPEAVPEIPVASSSAPEYGAQHSAAPVEGTPIPSNAETSPEAATPPDAVPEPEAPHGPLPDLRHGIPSTFDFEFGGKKEEKAADLEEGRQESPDLTENTATASGGAGGRIPEEREYTQKDFETSLDRRRRRLGRYLMLAVLAGGVGSAVYFARPIDEADEAAPSGLDPSSTSGWSPVSMYARVRARMGSQLGYYTEPSFPKLLPTVPESQRPPFTLVLSLEDLMIHTTWDRKNGYRTAKRPGIDYFIRYLSQYYELVLFTSVPISIADPVIKKLDPYHFIMWPLGREATKYEKGEYLKDLEYLNRDLSKTIIIDTHAPHVKNQPENAIVLPKWTGDPKDPHVKDLVALIPFLEYVATMGTDDVRKVLSSFADSSSIPTEFARREALARQEFESQLAVSRSRAPKHSLGSLFGSGLGIKADRAGGMVLGDGQSVAEGLAQGKMLSDQIREQGQKQYEALEKQIRENGKKWLEEEEAELKRMGEEQMKEMKKGAFSWFGGGGKKE
ncbi:mitochondrial inner membrane protein required for protein import [Oleoguttula sp. CCFEE 5521]